MANAIRREAVEGSIIVRVAFVDTTRLCAAFGYLCLTERQQAMTEGYEYKLLHCLDCHDVHKVQHAWC